MEERDEKLEIYQLDEVVDLDFGTAKVEQCIVVGVHIMDDGIFYDLLVPTVCPHGVEEATIIEHVDSEYLFIREDEKPSIL